MLSLYNICYPSLALKYLFHYFPSRATGSLLGGIRAKTQSLSFHEISNSLFWTLDENFGLQKANYLCGALDLHFQANFQVFLVDVN